MVNSSTNPTIANGSQLPSEAKTHIIVWMNLARRKQRRLDQA